MLLTIWEKNSLCVAAMIFNLNLQVNNIVIQLSIRHSNAKNKLQ